ncbi:hypothetical protein Anapl_02825 [Anas platyrhynchos]|uniref:Uncharacterized protein n=1 Tax=Anas platyrhynchos TaxID=8839 RepID=R0JR96_ANAPL|nr:hypothetical protein Anapl_02825 [Anas platyrhynchos]
MGMPLQRLLLKGVLFLPPQLRFATESLSGGEERVIHVQEEEITVLSSHEAQNTELVPRSREVGPRRVTSRSCCYHSVQELDREHSKAHNCTKPQGISVEHKCSCSAVQRPDLEGKGCQSASARESQLSLHGWHQAQAAEGTESAAKPPAPLPVWFWTPGQSPELSLIGNARVQDHPLPDALRLPGMLTLAYSSPLGSVTVSLAGSQLSFTSANKASCSLKSILPKESGHSQAFTPARTEVSWCEQVDTRTNRAGAAVQPSPSPGAAPGTVEQQDHELQRKTGTEGKQTFARAGALLRLVALLTCSHLPLFLLFHDRQQVGASGMCVRKEDVAGASTRVSDIRGCVHGALSAQIRELPQTGACHQPGQHRQRQREHPISHTDLTLGWLPRGGSDPTAYNPFPEERKKLEADIRAQTVAPTQMPLVHLSQAPFSWAVASTPQRPSTSELCTDFEKSCANSHTHLVPHLNGAAALLSSLLPAEACRNASCHEEHLHRQPQELGGVCIVHLPGDNAACQVLIILVNGPSANTLLTEWLSPTTGQAVPSSCGLSCGSTAAHGVVYREGQAPCLQIKIRLSNVCWQHIDTHTNRHALKPLTHAQAQISGVSPLPRDKAQKHTGKQHLRAAVGTRVTPDVATPWVCACRPTAAPGGKEEHRDRFPAGFGNIWERCAGKSLKSHSRYLLPRAGSVAGPPAHRGSWLNAANKCPGSIALACEIVCSESKGHPATERQRLQRSLKQREQRKGAGCRSGRAKQSPSLPTSFVTEPGSTLKTVPVQRCTTTACEMGQTERTGQTK